MPHIRIRQELWILSASESSHAWLLLMKSKISRATGESSSEIPIPQRCNVWSVDSLYSYESETPSRIQICPQLRILSVIESTHPWLTSNRRLEQAVSKQPGCSYIRSNKQADSACIWVCLRICIFYIHKHVDLSWLMLFGPWSMHCVVYFRISRCSIVYLFGVFAFGEELL